MATGLQKDDSIWLCKTLETIGISALSRRQCKSSGTFQEIIVTIGLSGVSSTSAYVFGSSIEGTTVSDLLSDMDILCCNELFPVREHLPKESTGYELLMITEPDTSAGYVKLQLVKKGLPLTIKEREHIPSDIKLSLKEDHCGRIVLNNSPPILDLGIKIEKHGPAETLMTYKEPAIDHVNAYRCRSWPSVADEWIKRKRSHGWPQQRIIKHFKTLGCFVVGVGHHDSTENNLEWRLSFSLQERQLMFKLNDVQYKCYVLLKLIKTDVITATVEKSFITSYHCKTCLFYMIERNPLDVWKPENLFSCVKQCLQLLLKWTTDSYCPNYFIPAENMFDLRIKGLRKKVIEILNEILSEGFGVLNRIKTSRINEYLQYRGNKALHQSLRGESASDIENYVASFQLKHINAAIVMLWRMLYEHLTLNVKRVSADVVIRVVGELIQRLSNSVPITEDAVKDTQEVVDCMLPFLHTILASHMASYAMICTDPTELMNSIRESMKHESEKHYKHGMSSDLTSGRLKYLTYLYFDGQYSECERQLKMLEKRYKNFDIRLPGYGQKTNFSPQIFCKADLMARHILRTYVHASVMFLPTEYPCHDALKFEMFRSFGTPQHSRNYRLWYWYDWAVVDSKVYMYFLWYLLSTKMNKPVLDRFYVIFKLILCTYDFLLHKETAFNLISWICLQEGFIQQAMRFLIASWQEVENRDRNEYPGLEEEYFCHHNAAKWHMLLIVKRLLDNGKYLQEARDFLLL